MESTPFLTRTYFLKHLHFYLFIVNLTRKSSKGGRNVAKKSKSMTSKFQKWSKIVIWIMLLAMVGSALISVIYSLFVNL